MDVNLLNCNYVRIFYVVGFLLLVAGLSACNQEENLAEVMSAQPAVVDVEAMPPMAKEHAARLRVMDQAKMAGNVTGGGATEPMLPANMEMMKTSEELASVQPQDAVLKKYIALHHYITVEASTDKMQAVFNAAMSRCQALKCEILAANYSDDKIQPPLANLSARLPPESVDAFIAGFDKSVDITQHQRTSEDKTDQVVDMEARIKNLTEFRDSLRELLKNKTAKFKDLIEVQRELANTQSEIDSLHTMRKLLAKETELVALDINFIAKQGVTEHGFFAPIVEALKQAGSIVMTSFANIILLFVRAIPWILLAIPVLIFVRKRWAKIKAKR